MSRPLRGAATPRALTAEQRDLLVPPAVRELAHQHELEFRLTMVERGGGRPREATLSRFFDALAAGNGELEATRRLADLGRLSASVVHEVRNVMTGVIGLAQVAERRPDATTNAGVPLTRMIADEAQRGLAVLSQFLRLASGSRGGVCSVELPDLLSATAAIIAHHLQMAQVRLDLAVESDVPAVLAHAEAIKQVLINLALNASEAASGGQGRIQIAARRAGAHVEIVVADNGPGIPARIVANLFQPFFSTRGSAGGTGLGLYVSRKLIEADGGTIDVQSEEGRGTTFTIRLPAATPATARGTAA